MSSQRRIDSSRANGAKSPEGRARSRASGLTHRLTASQLLLEGESGERFSLREEYLAECQPQTRFWFDLVDQLVAARWRRNRILALQTALMDRQIARQEPEIRREYKVCDAETRAAIADHPCADSRGIESLNRHETRLSDKLRRTLKLLATQLENQKLHDESNRAKPPHSDEDTSVPEAPRLPSAIDHPPSTSSDSSALEAPRFPSAINHPPSTTTDAQLENRKLHDEPNNAEPPHSDEDSPGSEAPRFPSAIDRPPSTSSDSPAPEAPPFPSAVNHPPSTTKHAQLENRELHDEPSDTQPTHSDKDGPAAEDPPSTIDHPPSTPPSPENEPPKLPLMVSRSMK